MEKDYFSYIRVSTARQGEHGVSLLEQQDAILRYAQKQNLNVVRFFEEKETAAKRGRPVFTQMLRLLKRKQVRGVIIHKIDRGARNLKDWADLADLIDAGVEVHFANESLDLNTRGGRLSADIQAVVAADYIRNLREETKKGFYGRLKQGIYPNRAPIGYVNNGGGRPKTPHPEAAPLIREAFRLYATGTISLIHLVEEMHSRGLRNRRGGKVSPSGMSTILNNPFYIGIIRLHRTGEHFAGIHEPIVDKQVFDIVQLVLKGKAVSRIWRHDFAYSRMIKCDVCKRTVMAEAQKGHTYYRCHTKACETKCVREEIIEASLVQAFTPLHLNRDEESYIRQWFIWKRSAMSRNAQTSIHSCNLQLAQIRDRLNRLTDAFLDQAIDRTILDERRSKLLMEEAGVKQRLRDLEAGDDHYLERAEQFLELARAASIQYKTAAAKEKRVLAKSLTSNLWVGPKYAAVTLNRAAQLIANRPRTLNSTPYRGVPRTLDLLLEKLMREFEDENQAGQTINT